MESHPFFPALLPPLIDNNKNGKKGELAHVHYYYCTATRPARHDRCSARFGSQRIGMETTSSKRAWRSRGLLIAGKRAQLTRGLAIERALELGIY